MASVMIGIERILSIGRMSWASHIEARLKINFLY